MELKRMFDILLGIFFLINTVFGSDCGGIYTSREGSIQSPNYPDLYPIGVECFYKIIQPVGHYIILNFEDQFNIARGSHYYGCDFNFVEVRDGDSVFSPMLLRPFCGSIAPPIQISTNNTMWISFKTSKAPSGKGFRASFKAACGGTLTSKEGLIMSNSSSAINFNNSDCIYKIVIGAALTITINFTYIHLEVERNCSNNYIEVRDGDSPNSPLLRPRVCGPSLPLLLRSTSNSVWIIFRFGRYTTQHQGFSAFYNTYCGQVYTSLQGYIRSPYMFPRDMHNLDCFYVISFPENDFIELTFFSFRLSADFNCTSSFVQIRDGDSLSSPALSRRFCGRDIPSVQKSSQNKMLIYFKTKWTTISDRFEAMYKRACKFKFSSPYGVIQSPSYPDIYSSGMNCEYTISQPPGQRIILNFTDFLLEAHDSCTLDYLEIRDGGTADSPLLGNRLCGVSIPSTRKTTQNMMWILFKTDISSEFRGFNASFISEPLPQERILLMRKKDIVLMDKEAREADSYVSIPVDIIMPGAIDYDSVDGRVYWTDLETKEIRSALLNGSDETLVSRLDQDAKVVGLAVDEKSRLVFYSDAEMLFISLVTMSGKYHKYVIDTDVDQPRSLALDTTNGVMFWSDWGRHPRIERAWYDGSGRTTLCNTSLQAPTALTFDELNSRLYWIDAKTSKIEWSDLDGGQRTHVFLSVDVYVVGLAVFKSYLYMASVSCSQYLSTDSCIIIMNTTSNEVENKLEVWGSLKDIHVSSWNANNQSQNACGLLNGGCSHICIPVPGNNTKCLCPEGHELDFLQRTCARVPDACAQDNGGCSHHCIALPRNRTKCWCPDEQRLDTDNKTCISDCGRNYTVAQGMIQSPSFPKNYSANVNCHWVIKASEGYRIKLTFTVFNLENDILCSKDYLEIRDGELPTSPLLGPPLCGSSLPSAKMTSSNVMRVHFKTDGSVVRKGFRAFYKSFVARNEYFLVITYRHVNRVEIDTQIVTTVPLSMPDETSVVYDNLEARVYWTTDGFVNSAFLNGSDIKHVNSFCTVAAGTKRYLAMDPDSRLIFYTDNKMSVIGYVTISTYASQVIISTHLENPRSLNLHTTKRLVFWVNGKKESIIERANYDGSNRSALVNATTGSLVYLAIDSVNDRLYWGDFMPAKVHASDLYGNRRSVIYQSDNTQLTGLVFFNNNLYTVEYNFLRSLGHKYQSSPRTVRRMNVNGSGVTTIYTIPYENILIYFYSDDKATRSPKPTTTISIFSNISDVNQATTFTPLLSTELPLNKETVLPSRLLTAITHPTQPPVTFKFDAAFPLGPSSSSESYRRVTSLDTRSLTTTALESPTSDLRSLVRSARFYTDGTQELTLTCLADANMTSANVVIYKWNVPCVRQLNSTCIVVPRIPDDDGKEISCTMTTLKGDDRVTSFALDLMFPPTTPPEILGHTSEIDLEDGDSLTVGCIVRGGKPLVKSVQFSCGVEHSHYRRDFIGQFEVISIITIPSLSARDNVTTCVCTAVWNNTNWYKLRAETNVLLKSPPNNRTDHGKTPMMGQVVGGSVFSVVIIVTFVIIGILIWKKVISFDNCCRGPKSQDDMHVFSVLAKSENGEYTD